ncbi:MAG: hypothetical protein ACREC6_13270 [Hyphomicrobiaceae bacterium]
MTLSAEQWSEARRRAAVIGPLADSGKVSQREADAAAQSLGFTSRSIYAFVRLWRETGGSVAALAPPRPRGGKGKSRLDAAVDAVIDEVIQRLYLSAEKPRPSKVVTEIRRQCRLHGKKPPSENTVKVRINLVRPDRAAAKRSGSPAAFRLKPAPGVTPEAQAPLDIIQMDHTKIDIQLVDPKTRPTIGRPFLTVAINGFSRCIVGICVTLDAPSATSVGLCLAHAATEKRPWIEKLGLDCAWPMRGKPRKVAASGQYSKAEVAAEVGASRHTLWRALSKVNEE